MFSSLRMVTTTPILPTQTITARTTITPLFPGQPPSFSISDARTPPANSVNSKDSSTPWLLPVPTKMPIASQSTAAGGNFVETSWDRNRILCLLGNTQLCSLVLIAQAQPAQSPITNIQKPITTNNSPVPNKSFGNSNYHSNILKVQTQPKSMPANRSITTVQNKTVQSNPYSGLWSMCNTMKMLNMVQRDLIKVCSFAEMVRSKWLFIAELTGY
uniref:Uncharacterized protein n=1 Tax=Ciona savignyi TaxID=51511 RepID=H2Y694_CIOSA